LIANHFVDNALVPVNVDITFIAKLCPIKSIIASRNINSI